MNPTLFPMRPKTRIPPLDRYAGPLPAGWHWQVKVDDERAFILPAGEIHNRHLYPLASHKAKEFRAPVAELLRLFPGETLYDVALLGFRGCRAERCLVLLDLPHRDERWRVRFPLISAACPAWDPRAVLAPPAGSVVHLPDYPLNGEGVRKFFDSTRGVAGLEGIVGRDPEAPYMSGDSDRMVKCRWK